MSTETAGTRIAHSGITRMFRVSGEREIVFNRGQMGTVYDTQGRAYIDFVMGYGPVILGHAPPDFLRRFIEYLPNGFMMPGYTHWHETYLERLLSGRDNQLGAFFKTASEAVTAALRVAALQTGRLGVIRCGFIGWHDVQIASSINWHEPLASPIREQLLFTRNMRGVGPDEPIFNWTDFDLSRLADLLRREGNRFGVLVFDAYLASFTDTATIRQAISLCHEAGVLVVFDETKTGGRISKLGHAADHGLDADLIVIGKSLGNGAPLSVLIGREPLLRHCVEARLSGTFSKELLAIYSALATLEIMQVRDGYATVGRIGQRVARVLTSAAEKASVAKWVTAKPVLGGGMFELCYAEEVLPAERTRRLLLRCFAEHGVLLLEGHPSFVCLGHEQLDWEAFENQAMRAFSQWRDLNEGALR